MKNKINSCYSTLIQEVNDSLSRILSISIYNAESLEGYLKQAIEETKIYVIKEVRDVRYKSNVGLIDDISMNTNHESLTTRTKMEHEKKKIWHQQIQKNILYHIGFISFIHISNSWAIITMRSSAPPHSNPLLVAPNAFHEFASIEAN